MVKKDLSEELRKAQELFKKEKKLPLSKMREAERFARKGFYGPKEEARHYKDIKEPRHYKPVMPMDGPVDETFHKEYKKLSFEQRVVATLSMADKYVKTSLKKADEKQKYEHIDDALDAVRSAILTYTQGYHSRSQDKEVIKNVYSLAEGRCIRYFNALKDMDMGRAKKWLELAQLCEDNRNKV